MFANDLDAELLIPFVVFLDVRFFYQRLSTSPLQFSLDALEVEVPESTRRHLVEVVFQEELPSIYDTLLKARLHIEYLMQLDTNIVPFSHHYYHCRQLAVVGDQTYVCTYICRYVTMASFRN